ncbi:copper-transporting ATPase, partial [Cymbomonas tetramitiformis]
AAKQYEAWQLEEEVRLLGLALAQNLTNGGFDSRVRDASSSSTGKIMKDKREQRLQHIRESTRRLVVAWGLVAICLTGHLAHAVPVLPNWLHLLCKPQVHAALSVFALLGPGRATLVDGVQCLMRNSPNMNTLVSIGALASFGVCCQAGLCSNSDLLGRGGWALRRPSRL